MGGQSIERQRVSESRDIEKEESRSNNTPHDRLFKGLLSAFFFDFIEIFCPEVLEYVDTSSVEFLQQEILHDMVEGSKRIVDLIAKVKWREQESFLLINVEAQASDESKFDRRLFSYFSRLHLGEGLPVYPIALFTFDKPYKKRENGYKVAFPNKTVLDFQYDAIQLNRLDWREYLKKENPLATALMIKMDIKPDEQGVFRKECLRLLSSFKLDEARRGLLAAFVDAYLPRLNAEEQRKFEQSLQELTNDEREGIMEYTNSWKEEGIEIGLIRGQQQGSNSLILQLLNHKFGSIDANLEEQVELLPLEQSQALGKALLDFKEEADLVQWLQENTPKKEGH